VAAALAPFTVAGPPSPPPRRGQRRRRLQLVVALAAVVVGVAAAAAVVVRIQTDQGEVTIQTDDPNIAVVVKKGGTLVRIIDPQSKQSWELDPQQYQLGMADQPDGLTIALDRRKPFILKRNGERLVVIASGPSLPTTPADSDRDLDDALRAPPDTVRGAAARVRLDETGAEARKALVRFLTDQDLVRWPEAHEALITSLRTDRNESVRYETAMALGRPNCCTPGVIAALRVTAAGDDRDGNPRETSERVRAAARSSLEFCLKHEKERRGP
jgi:hypothetical protein